MMFDSRPLLGSYVCLALLACAETAATKVTVSLDEVEVDTVDLIVRRDTTTLVDCTLTLDEPPLGLCPFTGGEGAWSDPRALSFWLQGDAAQPFELEAFGFRDGQVVTSSRSSYALPMEGGERGEVRLELPSPTRPRPGCEVQFAALGGGGVGISPVVASRESMTAIPSREPSGRAKALLVSSRNALYQVDYARAPGGACRLSSTLIVDGAVERAEGERWCRIREGSLVAAESVDGVVVAALCDDTANGGARLKFMRISRGDFPTRITTFALSHSRTNVSSPILVDTDGDGYIEVALAIDAATSTSTGTSASREARLFRAGFVESQRLEEERPMRGIALTRFGRRLMAPLVVPAGDNGVEAVFVPGGERAYIFANGRDQTLVAPTGAPSMSFARPPAMLRLSPGRIVVVGVEQGDGEASRVTMWPFEQRMEGSWAPLQASSHSLGVELSVGLQQVGTLLPVSVGAGPDASSAPWVAMAQGDTAYVVTVTRDLEVREIDAVAPSMASSGAGHPLVLWANLDARPGAELISFRGDGRALSAKRIDGEVAKLPGWPLTLWSEGAQPRPRPDVLLTDLDGVSDARGGREVEVVVRSLNRLRVIPLGTGSYDPEGMDWPMIGGDPAGGGRWVRGRDPLGYDAVD